MMNERRWIEADPSEESKTDRSRALCVLSAILDGRISSVTTIAGELDPPPSVWFVRAERITEPTLDLARTPHQIRELHEEGIIGAVVSPAQFRD